MVIKAKFEKGNFIPIDESKVQDLDNGEIVEIEIVSDNVEDFNWKGALKHIKRNSVELQHEIKNCW